MTERKLDLGPESNVSVDRKENRRGDKGSGFRRESLLRDCRTYRLGRLAKCPESREKGLAARRLSRSSRIV